MNKTKFKIQSEKIPKHGRLIITMIAGVALLISYILLAHGIAAMFGYIASGISIVGLIATA